MLDVINIMHEKIRKILPQPVINFFKKMMDKIIPPTIRWSKYYIKYKIEHNQKLDEDFLKFFSRDPERKVPRGKNIIVAPADGIINRVYLKKDKKIMVISMNLYDVHVQRVPISGKVRSIKKAGSAIQKGGDLEERYFRDELDYSKDYLLPVQKITTLDTEIGKVIIRQITSIWTRRIETFVKPGDYVNIGERLGRIYFGSTVVLELPGCVKFKVSLFDEGKNWACQRVKAGETIIATY